MMDQDARDVAARLTEASPGRPHPAVPTPTYAATSGEHQKPTDDPRRLES